jgi:hypothetical protein
VLIALVALLVMTAGARPQPSPVDALKSLGLSEQVRADEDRLTSITTETLLEAKSAPLFAGKRGVDATALLMLGIAFHESGFLPDVESCVRRGDSGHAYGLPQLHAEHFGDYTAEEFCASRVAQWERQANLLRRVKAWCKSIDPQLEDRGPIVWLGAYNSGQCGVSKAGTQAYANFERMARVAGIRVEKHGRRWAAY